MAGGVEHPCGVWPPVYGCIGRFGGCPARRWRGASQHVRRRAHDRASSIVHEHSSSRSRRSACWSMAAPAMAGITHPAVSNGGPARTLMRPRRAGSARPSRRPRTTAIRTQASSRSLSRVCPRRIEENRVGRALHQLRRPGWHGGRHDAGDRDGAVRPGQRPLRPRRLRSARRRAELAVDRLRREPGDRGPLLEAVHHAREPRRQGAAGEGQGLRQALRQPQQGHPAVRLDRQRGA